MDVPRILEHIDENFDDVDIDHKVDYIKMAIDDICGEAPWPFLEKTVTLTGGDTNEIGADGELKITDARSILKIVSVSAPTELISWVRRDVHLAENADDMSRAGDPIHFYTFADKFYVWPIPGSGDFIVDYVRLHPAITSTTNEAGILIPPRAHELILLRALYRLYARDEDHESAGAFKAQYDEKLFKVREDLFRKQYDRPDQIFLLDEADYDYS